MNSQRSLSTKKIVLTALLAALTTAGSAIRITIPLEVAGTTSFHLGNILCALSGILLGPWLGGFAAGLGSAMYDVLNPAFLSDAWITFLTKAVYGICAGLLAGKSWGYGKATAATAAGAVAYAFLYLAKSYFYNGILLGGLTPAAAFLAVGTKLPATIFNAAVAVVFTPMLANAIRSALKQNRLSME